MFCNLFSTYSLTNTYFQRKALKKLKRRKKNIELVRIVKNMINKEGLERRRTLSRNR